MQEVSLIIETDEATSIELRNELGPLTNDELIVQRRENLSGIAADFITVIQAVSPIIAAVMPFVIEKSKNRKVRRVRVGDLEIENPTDEQVRALWERFKAKNSEAGF